MSWGFGRAADPIPVVSVETMLADTDPHKVILDVREPSETMMGHIAGALLIPLGEIERATGAFADDANVYVVCRSGNRSAFATEALMAAGKTNVKNVEGGMIAWVNAGHPISH
jgi:phage shock protein E